MISSVLVAADWEAEGCEFESQPIPHTGSVLKQEAACKSLWLKATAKQSKVQ